jgi:RNA polymerase sigma-70 factor (ECF subfamily)
MTSRSSSSTPADEPAAFEALAQEIRPELHRYCARMIGSVVDAEDVVQEALAKAYAALPATSVANMRGWLFRIAHNKAIDYLRRASQQHMDYLDERALLVEPDPPLAEQELVAVALSVFLKLAPKQRSCVILKDVMGYSLADISELLDATIPEIKAALHRGRARLRELAPGGAAHAITPRDEQERELLARYIDRFNARDFDAVRAMLAHEVRLELINRSTRRGRADVSEYFHRYDDVADWHLALGAVERRPAILVYDPRQPSSQPAYFVLIKWDDAQVSLIRDYRYATYVMRDIELEEPEQPCDGSGDDS